jgi:hypothetical protein
VPAPLVTDKLECLTTITESDGALAIHIHTLKNRLGLRHDGSMHLG